MSQSCWKRSWQVSRSLGNNGARSELNRARKKKGALGELGERPNEAPNEPPLQPSLVGLARLVFRRVEYLPWTLGQDVEYACNDGGLVLKRCRKVRSVSATHANPARKRQRRAVLVLRVRHDLPHAVQDGLDSKGEERVAPRRRARLFERRRLGHSRVEAREEVIGHHESIFADVPANEPQGRSSVNEKARARRARR